MCIGVFASAAPITVRIYRISRKETASTRFSRDFSIFCAASGSEKYVPTA